MLHVAAARHHDGLTSHVRKQRAGDGQNTARRLRRRASPSQGNVARRRRGARPGALLLLRDAQRNLGAAGPFDKGALLLGRRQPRRNVAKGDGVGADAERGAPFLGDGLGEARHAGLGQGVVDLARVAVDARRRRDVDDGAGLAVLDAEVGGRGADNVEGRGGVQRDDGLPLLVRHLVDDAVPRVAGVVDNDVDLAVAKLGGLVDEQLDVGAVEDVAGHADGLAAGLVDGGGDGIALFYKGTTGEHLS